MKHSKFSSRNTARWSPSTKARGYLKELKTRVLPIQATRLVLQHPTSKATATVF
eukprot:m.83991 g.83991  ORF g.83991 m.83991 type:complete len:54 (-) comp14371_c0_seq5:453-614(-)